MTVMTSRKLHLKCVKKPIILSTFSSCDPQVKTVLFNSHCLSLYGGALWNITCRQLTSLKVAFNNILRWIWKLPRNCHTQILHKIARLDSALITCTFLWQRKTCESNSYLLHHCFTLFNTNVLTPVGSNCYCARKYAKLYFEEEHIRANFAKYMCISNSSVRDWRSWFCENWFRENWSRGSTPSWWHFHAASRTKNSSSTWTFLACRMWCLAICGWKSGWSGMELYEYVGKAENHPGRWLSLHSYLAEMLWKADFLAM